jgi:ferredoxin
MYRAGGRVCQSVSQLGDEEEEEEQERVCQWSVAACPTAATPGS